MRVALSADMEGIAGITDAREVLACERAYWAAGRRKLTADVVAAAQGLLEGGADEVIVLDNHGSGNPWNVLVEDLPRRARAEAWDVFDLPGRGVDAMLQVGYHPRRGIAGFLPHTYVPGLHLRVDGEEIGESHGRIWAAQAALLGIVGHAAHGRALGSLAGTPFLAVQDGADLHAAAPVHRDARESAEAIRRFARERMQAAASAPRPVPPADFTFEASVDAVSESAAAAMADAGWQRLTDETFTADLPAWPQARRPLAAAMAAAMEPFAGDLAALDLTSQAAFERQSPERVARLSALFLDTTAAMGPDLVAEREHAP